MFLTCNDVCTFRYSILLNQCKAHVYDFWSAFNTIQCHLLAYKLLEMKIRLPSGWWITDYLTNRPQFVRTGTDVKSETTCTNTGAPHGTVVFPFLISLYTADCRSQHENRTFVKFADDTGLTGRWRLPLLATDLPLCGLVWRCATRDTSRRNQREYSGIESKC